MPETIRTDGPLWRNVATRLLWPRFAWPAGGFRRAQARLPPPRPRSRADNAALLVAFVGLPCLSVAALSCAPLPAPDVGAIGPAAALNFAWFFALQAALQAPSAVAVLDSYVGGVHPASTGRSVSAAAVASMLLLTAAPLAALGFFPLYLGLLTAAVGSTVIGVPVLLARLPLSAAGDVLQAANRVSEMGMGPVLATVAYLCAVPLVDSQALRVLFALLYDAVMWVVKHRTRRLRMGDDGQLGVVLSELWQDGLATGGMLWSFPLMSWPAVAVLAAVQIAGTLAPVIVLALPAWLRPLSKGAAGEQLAQRAAWRVALSCLTHAHVASFAVVVVWAARAGPNAQWSAAGHWPRDEALSGALKMGAWAAVFVALLLVSRRRLVPGVDALGTTLDLVAQHLAVAAAPLITTVTTSQLLVLAHGNVMWFAYDQNGYSS